MKVRKHDYMIKNPNIKKEHQIAVISDIHSDTHFLESILEYLKTLHPEYVLIIGDLFDQVTNKNNEKIVNLIKKYKSNYQIIMTTGNHEYLIRKKIAYASNPYLETLRKEIPILENNLYNKEDISFYGITPPIKWYLHKESFKEFQEFIKPINLQDNTFNFVLSHSPNGFINSGKLVTNPQMDLIVSGHNHGGLTPYWFQKKSKKRLAFTGPYMSMFKKYAYGIYENNQSTLIISNGITKVADKSALGPFHKVMNACFISDIEWITLLPGKKEVKEQKVEIISI